MSQKPSIGRIVHYVLSQADSPTSFGRVRPAIIVELVEDGSEEGLVNLQVFTNGGIDQLPPVQHCKNIVHYEKVPHPNGTWHWPPFVAPGKPVPVLEAPADAAPARRVPRTYEEQLKMEASENAAPFPTTPDTGSMAAAFAAGEIPPPPPRDPMRTFDPVAAERATEPFPPDSEEESET